MAAFNITIPNLGETLKAFEAYGESAQGAVYAGMLRTALEAQTQARTTVHKVTTNLARSITLEERRQDLEIDVFTNVEYAAIEEFGFDGPQYVRKHERTVSQAFGRRITPVTATVTAHTRQVFREPHPYMGPAAESAERAIAGNVLAELEVLRL